MQNIALVILLLLTGCATGSQKVTGLLRPPVPPNEVVIYYSSPANSEIIGKISAGSFGGLTFQNASDFALDKLKREAGQMGANGVVLEYLDNRALEGAKVRGKAIFVLPATSCH